MSVEAPPGTKLEGFKPNQDLCGACRMDLEKQGWSLLCDWCHENLNKIYSLEIEEIEYHNGMVYSV